MSKAKIKEGDKVKVITGNDKGKVGEVIQVLNEDDQRMVVVEGVNKLKKHVNPRQSDRAGEIIELPAPIDVSNVMLLDPETEEPTKVGFTYENGNKKRVSKQTDNIID
ncbi:MAG: 50S ribosomal protein L24 [Parcubacteria group bacterium QH_9_35_7]|nr:MAG: 50S ribosomal protein L24 [Parcubacteria group bacterium QH_9_35_7]